MCFYTQETPVVKRKCGYLRKVTLVAGSEYLYLCASSSKIHSG